MKKLSPAQTAGIGEQLARRRVELLSEIETRLAAAKTERIAPDAVATTDGGDKALLEMASGLDLAIVRHDLEELRAIEGAQARLDQGEFGACSDCGDDIQPERLLAWPTATRCTACQNEFERSQAGVPNPRP